MCMLGVAADEPIYVTMQLPYEWNMTLCHPSRHRSCSLVHIYTCVHFQASEFVFPPGRFDAYSVITKTLYIELCVYKCHELWQYAVVLL